MLFDALFILLFIAAWMTLGAAAWIPLALRRRAVGGLLALPAAMIGAAGAGAAVPLAGLDTGLGVGVSMIAAALGGGLAAAAAFRLWDAYGLGERFAGLARGAGEPFDSGERRGAISSLGGRDGADRTGDGGDG